MGRQRLPLSRRPQKFAAASARATAACALAAGAVVLAVAPSQAGAHACDPIVQDNYYRVHITVSQTSCVAARALYPSVAVQGISKLFDVWGVRFRSRGWTCQRKNLGLGGSEYHLRCGRSTSRILFRRGQDNTVCGRCARPERTLKSCAPPWIPGWTIPAVEVKKRGMSCLRARSIIKRTARLGCYSRACIFHQGRWTYRCTTTSRAGMANWRCTTTRGRPLGLVKWRFDFTGEV